MPKSLVMVGHYHKVLHKSWRRWLTGCNNREGIQAVHLLIQAQFKIKFGLRAGIGWIAIMWLRGVWFLGILGEVLTNLDLTPDAPLNTAAPVLVVLTPAPDAITQPFVVDANRCIATIENRAEMPDALLPHFQGWVAGCDICQDVCPGTSVLQRNWCGWQPHPGMLQSWQN